jgi:protein disulfide-isomerase
MLFSLKCDAIEWQTDFQQATQVAKEQNKPLVLFFTGTDWCVWCKKLESEALDTREFDADAGNKFVFVKLDFPRNGAQNPQNDELQRRFNVRGFPSVIILDSHGNQMGSTGYKQGGGKAYADHLLKLAGVRRIN